MKSKIILVVLTIVSSVQLSLIQPRLVGGIETDEHSAPFIVSIAVRTRRSGYVPFCAGALLNENWILTAAHCLQLDAFRMHLLAGHHDMQNLNNETTQIRRSDFFIEHNDFDNIGPYDIGLIHVSRPFNLTEFVKPIEMSTDPDPIGNITAFGWGSTSFATEERIYPTKLQSVNLTLVTYEYCENSFNQLTIDRRRNICAGLPTAGKSACVGDSGGPVTQNDKLVGVVSWGPITCDVEAGPSVFTKVQAYQAWIQSRMENGQRGEEDDDDDEDDDEDVASDENDIPINIDVTDDNKDKMTNEGTIITANDNENIPKLAINY